MRLASFPIKVKTLACYSLSHSSYSCTSTCLAPPALTFGPRVGAGRVRRARDRVDERQVSIFLTPAGLALRDELACIPDEAGGLTGFDIQGRKDLLHDLVTLRLSLQAGLASD